MHPRLFTVPPFELFGLSDDEQQADGRDPVSNRHDRDGVAADYESRQEHPAQQVARDDHASSRRPRNWRAEC